jgi:hypothetical protein
MRSLGQEYSPSQLKEVMDHIGAGKKGSLQFTGTFFSLKDLHVVMLKEANRKNLPRKCKKEMMNPTRTSICGRYL